MLMVGRLDVMFRRTLWKMSDKRDSRGYIRIYLRKDGENIVQFYPHLTFETIKMNMISQLFANVTKEKKRYIVTSEIS
jgi:hypothetical protein